MIKIFRKIRQRLIMKNQKGRYFKYAIGEIVLVIIGILIALQVNNWNEGRKKREFELTMLKEVQKELIEDSGIIESWIPILKNVQHSFKELAIMKKNPTHNPDSLEIHLKRIGRYGITLNVNKSNFEAIKSAGLDRISNAEIRNKLSTLYGYHMQGIDEWVNEVLRVELFNRNEIFYELFDPMVIPNDDGTLSSELKVENPSLLFKNPKFDELLLRSSWPLPNTIRRLTYIHEQMTILNKLIDEELKL
jgi:hypothetical protein